MTRITVTNDNLRRTLINDNSRRTLINDNLRRTLINDNSRRTIITRRHGGSTELSLYGDTDFGFGRYGGTKIDETATNEITIINEGG